MEPVCLPHTRIGYVGVTNCKLLKARLMVFQIGVEPYPHHTRIGLVGVTNCKLLKA